MADGLLHLAQAEHNEKLCNRLGRALAAKDWFVTTAFYSAIHYIEAALYDQNPVVRHSEDYGAGSFHNRRDNCVMQFFSGIDSQYRGLKDLCFTVRYLINLNQPAQDYLTSIFKSDDDLKETIKGQLKAIKTSLGY